MASRLWAVILAGGDGRRLRSLTRALYGEDLPKQFATLLGDRSLLQETVERVLPLVPAERIVVVVAVEHACTARAQLARYPGIDLVLQPANLDTGPGLLLPLARVLARDPDAHVAILPSDHHMEDAGPLLAALSDAATGAYECDRLALVGVAPDHPEVEYGWIVPGKRLARVRRRVYEVSRFVEKPAEPVARRLAGEGALWNTFILVAHSGCFWSLARRHLPVQAELLESYAKQVDRPGERHMLSLAYARMPSASFSRDVLERADDLLVIRTEGTGWSDWGSPQRVFKSLAGTADLTRLLERISASSGAAASPA